MQVNELTLENSGDIKLWGWQGRRQLIIWVKSIPHHEDTEVCLILDSMKMSWNQGAFPRRAKIDEYIYPFNRWKNPLQPIVQEAKEEAGDSDAVFSSIVELVNFCKKQESLTFAWSAGLQKYWDRLTFWLKILQLCNHWSLGDLTILGSALEYLLWSRQ